MIRNVVIIGTGLIGASIGLALRRAGFTGTITGVDRNATAATEALRVGAVDSFVTDGDEAIATAARGDLVVLAAPVLGILHWIEFLARFMGPNQLITDVGSTKLDICRLAADHFTVGSASFLPGHPMAGKESGGAALADASLFEGAMWLFTPISEPSELELEWRQWITKFGCRTMDLDAARHDRICAWVSHLPQMVATAMSATFADEFARDPSLAQEFEAIGGRALREMTRLGASPYSMWRDVAMTNTEPLAETLSALEQRLQHMRENLKTAELREEFAKANEFRKFKP